jgi:hypothetical protein
MRNGRDQQFTARAVAIIEAIASNCQELLSMRHDNGMPAMQFCAGDELEPLDILDDVVVQRNKWRQTRRQQGVFSQQQKLRKEAARLQQEVDALNKRADDLGKDAA